MTDHAKRLAEIEAKHALVTDHGYPLDATQWHQDRGFLLAEIRAASEAIPTNLVPTCDEHGNALSLADRVRILATEATAEEQMARDIAAASEALDALGVAPGSLAERVRALGVLAGRGPAPESDDVSTAHLRALEIVAYSDGTAVQLALAKELVDMGAEAVAEAVCRAYEEGRAAEARRLPRTEDDRLTPSERMRLEAQATPATRDFLAAMREMRRTGDSAKGLEAFYAFLVETMPRAAAPPPEPDLEPAVGDGPKP